MRTIIIDDDNTGSFQVIRIIIIIVDREDVTSEGIQEGEISMQFVTSDSTFWNSWQLLVGSFQWLRM